MENRESILFLEIFQPFAQYRNPFTFFGAQTYPLPPKSTIIGMLQNAIDDWYGSKFGVDRWWNLKISVHGGFESCFVNYQALIKGDILVDEHGRILNKNEENVFKTYLPLYGSSIRAFRSPTEQEELFNGHLFIFIRGDPEILSIIKEALSKPRKVLYLGRGSDIVFIKEVKFISQSDRKILEVKGDVRLTYPTYILAENFPIDSSKYPVYFIPVKVVFKRKNENGSYSPVSHKAEIVLEKEKIKREVEFKKVIYTGYEYYVKLKRNVDHPIVEVYKVESNGETKEFRIFKEYGWL